ncbi:PucR family transcriptional regulator [Paenibacillus sp. DMB20]|uniref:PucR family transcriptional regulator n=1 Tax=Paenibacillus sp. DMB20 TaxID=1642570 RepID=UPI00062786CF|nr:PucR family transcriptional regulator [Paenibacillus sp. DMB20]KKO52461.1 transcriptional regulator [Paenibacillus sp. DMB20]
MLTVKDILNIKAIEGIKLVAGAAGLDNQISIVNIIENPDVFDWLTSNELLLSTGYIFKDSEELQNKIIQELVENNCAGLCIKIKRYFDKVPRNMIDLADKHGLPILELPFEYTLSRVIAIINEKTNADYDAMNRRSLDLHNALFKIALEGGGIEQISAELADTIHNPVLILDRDWNLLGYTDHKDNEAPLRQMLPLVRNRPVFPAEFTEAIPKYISEIKKSIKRTYRYRDQAFKCRIMPVAVSNHVYGYIVVFQTIRILGEFDYMALEHVSTILALDRIKAKEIEAVKLKIKQDFFDDLLSGNFTSVETLHSLSDLHGLKVKYVYYCMVVHIEADKLEDYTDIVYRKYELEHIAKKCVGLIYGQSHKANGELTCYYRNQQIIILIGRNEEKPPIAVSETKTFAQELLELLSMEMREVRFMMGIGSQYKTLPSLHRSFFEAQEAMRLMQRFNDNRTISHFEDYSVYHFLDSNIKPVEMEAFFHKVLGVVHNHDQTANTRFISTLEYYFMYNQNITEAAKAMFIHRNTFIYRIDKIKELLGTDLKNADELFQIQLALNLYRLMVKG